MKSSHLAKWYWCKQTDQSKKSSWDWKCLLSYASNLPGKLRVAWMFGMLPEQHADGYKCDNESNNDEFCQPCK